MATVLGYSNQIDNATLGGGSWNASYPLSNLKNRYLSKTARSANTLAASTIITLNLGIAHRIGVVALVSHNLTANIATVRIQAYSDSGFTTQTYDSGALTAYSGSDFATTFSYIEAQFWKISITDTANASGYVSVGRVFIGWRFRPSNNIDWNASLGVESSTQFKRALGGPEFFDERPNRRVWQGKWSWLSDSEAYSTLIAIQRGADISREVYLMEDDTDTAYRNQRWFLGRFRTLSPVEWPYVSLHSVGIEIGELL